VPTTAPTPVNALTVVGRRKVAPPQTTYLWDVIRYYCVTYSVAGVGNEQCIQVYDYNFLNQNQLNALAPTPSDRSAYQRVLGCYDSAVAGGPLPDCWPR